MKPKIIITGGNGYIGSVLAANLSSRYFIYILDKSKKNSFLKYKNITFIKNNLIHYNKTLRIIKRINPEVVVHLAAQSTIDMVKKKKNSYFFNNILATENVVKITKLLKINKFIFSSTASVYKAKDRSLSENYILKPNNFYGLTKLKNEFFIKKAFHLSKTKFCILRFFNVCGADTKNKIGEFHNPETHIVPLIVNKILNHEKLYVYGNNYNTKDGTCIRDYVHVKDIVSGIIKSINYLDKGNSSTFNFGSESGFSVYELIKFCEKKLTIKAILQYKKRRFGDNSKLICNFKKAKKKLNWKPKYSSLNKIINDEIWWSRFLLKLNLYRKFIY
jgi:UDP-glucose 4-epimerase